MTQMVHKLEEKGYLDIMDSVSYTHLDVYKRQALQTCSVIKNSGINCAFGRRFQGIFFVALRPACVRNKKVRERLFDRETV